MTGDPFGELGDLLIDDVTFSAINDQSLYGRGNSLGSLYLAADHPGPGVPHPVPARQPGGSDP